MAEAYLMTDSHKDTQNETIIATLDAPMSFRSRHRFLDSVYNSYLDPDSISAKNLDNISKGAGLLMEEVLAWFEDEKGRRARILTSLQSGSQFPLSPPDTATPGSNSTITLSMSQYASSPGALPDIDGMFPPPAQYCQTEVACDMPTISERFKQRRAADVAVNAPVFVRARRGRPAKSRFPRTVDASLPDPKRQKCSTKYPCPDCDNILAIDRWSEHVKRVHFPDQVWECPKVNQRTRKSCGAKPFFRPDNFATHLRGEHCCGAEEISQLKIDCKYRTMNLFHQICGFCEETLEGREESIEHIKNHFKEISERTNPPIDLGLSEWKEKCKSDHKLKRGVHYHIIEANDNNSDRNQDDDEDGDPGQGESDSQPDNDSQDKQDKHLFNSRDDGAGDNGYFYSSSMEYQQYSTAGPEIFQNSVTDYPALKGSHFGLEGLTLPFTTLRKLGTGSHGSVEEVTTADFKETYARKSVFRKPNEGGSSYRMIHLRNELAILKNLDHPHLVKLIGAYTDADRSHIVMSPVADQNLAAYMRSSQSSQSKKNIRWMACLTSAMAYLHDRNIRHLDIKPQNILVKNNGILLADFGTAKSLFNTSLSDHESLAFTPMYCAPETIPHGQQDDSSDVFSLGCVFSEMITRYFGYSLQEFESFRAQGSNKAFHLAISKTKDWIKALPPILDPPTEFLGKVRENILAMLAETPFERPKASKLRVFFDYNLCNSCCVIADLPPVTINEGASFTEKKSKFCLDGSSRDAIGEAPAPTSASVFPPVAPHIDSPETQNYSKFGSSYEDFSLYPPPDHDYSFGFASAFEYPNCGFVDPSIIHESHSSNRTASLSASHPYPSAGPPTTTFHPSYGNNGNFASDESREKGRCPYPECRKIFKDLKAHMLTHQNERPEKCPVQTCDYHIKGFARKYDKTRHTLTHYKGTMVCGFCPGSGLAAEKSFNRADVFKRHLTSVHGVELTPPNSIRRKSTTSKCKTLSDYASDSTGKCSICASDFGNAQDFYNHLDDCVLKIVVQEIPTEAESAHLESEFDADAYEILPNNAQSTSHKLNEEIDKHVNEDDVDGPRRLWKDDMMLDKDYEVRIKFHDDKAYATGLDVHTKQRLQQFVGIDGEAHRLAIT
jgi:serine/threonine protein kinase